MPAGQPAALAASAAFQADLAGSDPGSACALLSTSARQTLESGSRKPCRNALPALGLPRGAARSIQVWGDNAQVRLTSSVVFLARFDTGWKVTRRGLPGAPGPALRLRSGAVSPCAVFVATLVFIALGLTYVIVLGLLQR